MDMPPPQQPPAIVQPAEPRGQTGNALLPGDAARSLASAVEQVQQFVRAFLAQASAGNELATVGDVDPDRYAGLWYEIARLPVRFQDASTVSTAEYAVRADGTLRVENTAYKAGKVDARIVGTATPVEEGVTDRFSVKFGGLLSLIPTPDEGNYWIIGLESDYSMALVGSPDKQYLWLLSRTKRTIDDPTARMMLAAAESAGFDLTELVEADWKAGVARPVGTR